ncbi:MAG: hypothetical protein RRY29_00240 [Desulfovibrionaceae bacterium]
MPRYFLHICLVGSLLTLLWFALLGGSAAFAADPPKTDAPPLLYANLPWGASKAALMRLPEMSHAQTGEGEFSQDLLVAQTHFAALTWGMRLVFNQDKLTRVSLMAPYSPERLRQSLAHLKTEHYEMLAVLVNDTRLDCVEILKTQGPQAVREKLVPLLAQKPQRVVYAWFQVGELSGEIKTMSSTLKNLLMSVPAHTKEVEVVLMAGEDGKPGLLLLEFSFPLL